MRIAIPSENGIVYQHFGHTPEFTIYEVESELIKNKEFVSTEGSGHEALADFLKMGNPDTECTHHHEDGHECGDQCGNCDHH